MRCLRLALATLAFASAQSAFAFQDPVPTPTPVPTPPPPPPTNPFVWEIGEYKLKLGGYVKVDLIHDFNQIGSQDSFDPRTIPVNHDPTLPDEGTRMHARQTRLNIDVTGPFRVFVEGDFFGDGNSFRLRHAFGEIDAMEGKLLAGQTWTTFMDDQAMPETLDFESPIAFPQVRVTQIRWTKDLGKGSYFAVSVEDPDSTVVVPTAVTGATSETTPDIDAGFNWTCERGHVRLGAWGGMVQFDTPTATADDAMLWGLNLATKLKTVGKDSVIAQVTYGDGVGRFRGGDVAALSPGGNLDAITVIALMGSYQHYWSDKFRSTIIYSWAAADPPSGLPPDTTERVDYFACNLIWQFNPRAWTGVEYLYGSRDSVSHDHGADNRIQFSVRFDI